MAGIMGWGDGCQGYPVSRQLFPNRINSITFPRGLGGWVVGKGAVNIYQRKSYYVEGPPHKW